MAVAHRRPVAPGEERRLLPEGARQREHGRDRHLSHGLGRVRRNVADRYPAVPRRREVDVVVARARLDDELDGAPTLARRTVRTLTRLSVLALTLAGGRANPDPLPRRRARVRGVTRLMLRGSPA